MHVALPDRVPREHESATLPVFMYPLLHVGVHELPLPRVAVHVPSAPFVGAVTAHGLAPHVALPERLPREHENVPVPEIVYPLLHVGVHELPLARLAVHVPSAPLAGAVTAQGLAPHTTVLLSVPAAHDRLPEIVYPLLHVGVHEAPLARLAVHVPATPFVSAADASHEANWTRHSSRNSPDVRRELSDEAAKFQCGDWSWCVLT
jgi:hypothetical protein